MRAKLLQLVSVGVRSFMIAFDDVEAGSPIGIYGSAAEAQAAVANRCCVALWHAMWGAEGGASAAAAAPAPMFLFCPTECENTRKAPATTRSPGVSLMECLWLQTAAASPSRGLMDLRTSQRWERNCSRLSTSAGLVKRSSRQRSPPRTSSESHRCVVRNTMIRY